MKKLAIGVDIGGINTAFGLVDENGDLYAESVISTKKYPYVDEESAGALTPADAERVRMTGIGIGAPERQLSYGSIERPANLWKFQSRRAGCRTKGGDFFTLCEDLGEAFFPGIPVRITNDANAATSGKSLTAMPGDEGLHHGNARDRSGVGVRCGTDKMIYGHDGMAGELGHVVVEPEDGSAAADAVAVWRPMFPRRVSSGRFSS